MLDIPGFDTWLWEFLELVPGLMLMVLRADINFPFLTQQHSVNLGVMESMGRYSSAEIPHAPGMTGMLDPWLIETLDRSHLKTYAVQRARVMEVPFNPDIRLEAVRAH